MTTAGCLFCKLVKKEIPAEILFENERVLGFRDIRPQAPVHALFIPKTHIDSARELTGSTAAVMGELTLAANETARKLGVSDRGYRLVVNVGSDGGQTVGHLHLHLLGSRVMTWPPG